MGEGRAVRRDDCAALERAAQTLDMRLGPIGEVAERSLPHLAVFAIALAQKDGRGASSDWGTDSIYMAG